MTVSVFEPGRRALSRGLLSATVSTLAALAAFAAAPAAAQNTPATEADDGNVIIVTAQMRSQNLQDTPLSITAVTGAMLEARSQTNLADITAQTPGLLLKANGSGSGNSMSAYIRGVGQADHSPSVEPGVGIYVDDVYFGTVTASAFDLVDLNRVEVLRGPQGTLAGMNSQGGAIKIYSRKPEGHGGFVEATVGTNGRLDVKGSADFTLVNDAVFGRVTGITRNLDGHVTRYDYACLNPSDPDVVAGRLESLTSAGNCKLGEMGDKKFYGFRGALRIAPSGSPLEVNLIGDYTRDTSQTQASTLLASAEFFGRDGFSQEYQGVRFDNRFVTYGEHRRPDAVLNDPYASYANYYDPGVMHEALDAGTAGPASITAGASLGEFSPRAQSKIVAWGGSGTVDYELSDNLALKSITGYRTYDSRTGSDNDNSPIVFIQEENLFSHEQFSQELRLSGSFADDTVHVTVGGIYYDASTRYNGRIHTPFSGFCPMATPCFSFINDDTSDMTVWAAFTNASVEVTDKLTLEGGIRVTDEKKDYTFGRYNPDGDGDYLPLSNPDNPLSGYTDTFAATIVDYRAVASYKWSDDLMTYAQFSTGHKAGGVSPRPYSFHQIRDFPAEKLRSYELGFKTDLIDRRLRLNGAVFYMDYMDYQGTPETCVGTDGNQLPPDKGGVPGLCGQYLAVADAKVKGFELEAFLEPVDGFTVDGSLSYVDFKFGKPNFPTTSVVEGASRPGIGDWKWNIGAQYRADLGNAGTITPRVDVNYTPGYCGTFACPDISKVDSHTLVNARITYRTANDDWSIALEATNLFDKLYYHSKMVPGFYANGMPGRPQEFALTVRRQF